MRRLTASLTVGAGICLLAAGICAQAQTQIQNQTISAPFVAGLPDAPAPQLTTTPEVASDSTADVVSEGPPQQSTPQQSGPPQSQLAPQEQSPGPSLLVPLPAGCPQQASTKTPPDRSCPYVSASQNPERYRRFANSNAPIALTPKQKFKLAAKNLVDPFNLLTITFLSAIDVASNAHGAYGPGMAGFGREVGTTFTEDMNGEFWGTFFMASVTHQDPHYHRMPNASIPRRALHCITAVVWAQSDSGRPMPNFVEIGGYSIAAPINNLYVPYRRANVESTVERVAVAMALDPIGNAVTEFLPDVARRLNIRIVFVQQIINKVASEQTGAGSPF